MKNRLVVVALAFAVSSCSHFNASENIKKPFLKEPAVENLPSSRAVISERKDPSCNLSEGKLVYKTAQGEKKITASVNPQEKILAFSCTTRLAILMTKNSLQIYPGTDAMEKLEPKNADYIYIGLDNLDGGSISKDGMFFVVWKGSSLEAYTFTRNGPKAVFSYNFNVDIDSACFSEMDSLISVSTANGKVVFDLSGKEVK